VATAAAACGGSGKLRLCHHHPYIAGLRSKFQKKKGLSVLCLLLPVCSGFFYAVSFTIEHGGAVFLKPFHNFSFAREELLQ